MDINVLMQTSEYAVSQLKVTMYSVCKNSNGGTKLFFTILCDKRLDKISKKRIAALQDEFPNVQIEFFEIDERDFAHAKSEHRVPIVAYYKLIAAKALSAKKTIYLDSDLIVDMDLAELYEIDIENYYLAGVQDIDRMMKPNFTLWHSENYNLKNFEDYINSGVLLMNLDLIRKDNLTVSFLEELNEKNFFLDQDVINRICSGKIYLIDWRFNHYAGYDDEFLELNCNLIKKKNTKEIIHFCGADKPWNNRFMKRADIWWDVAELALEKDVYDNLYRAASIGKGSERVLKIAEKCLDTDLVIIVGYSDHGVFVKNALLRYGINAKIIFCDNNPKKRTLLAGEVVYSVEEATKKYAQAIWINVVQKERNKVLEQLKALNVPDKNIYNYIYE